MAQTKHKRSRKHRGTPAGTIERAGRTGRPQTREDAKKIARQRRAERMRQAAHLARLAEPGGDRGRGVRRARGARCSADRGRAPPLAAFMLLLYIPLGYATDLAIYRFRQRRKAAARK